MGEKPHIAMYVLQRVILRYSVCREFMVCMSIYLAKQQKAEKTVTTFYQFVSRGQNNIQQQHPNSVCS